MGCREHLQLAVFQTIMILLAATVPCLAQEDQAYHERLEFDARTGDWVAAAPPIPGTEGGDLALARSLLAQGEYKKARKAFKAWFKAYPESPHWPEALFYAAETEVMAEDVKPKSGRLMKAYEWLEELLEGWPESELTDRAIRKELIIAEMFLFKNRKQRIWGGLLWLSAKQEALEMLDRIIDEWAPNTPIAEQALRLKADYHRDVGEHEEAELAYARLMREFPRGRYRRIAMLRAGEMALARFPGVEFDEADLLEAEVYLRDFQQQYAAEAAEYGIPLVLGNIRERRAEKAYKIGRYYERTRAIEPAVFYYRLVDRDWPATTWAAQARTRLAALGAIQPQVYDEGLGEDLEGKDFEQETQAAALEQRTSDDDPVHVED